MSHAILIAADQPLPPCERQMERTKTVKAGGKEYTISMVQGFRVAEHSYYREAVDDLGFHMKPYRYELELCQDETDLNHLWDYLRENFSPGETVELWSVWTAYDPEDRLTRYRGRLDEFDLETMGMLEKWNTCITIEM